MLKLAALMFVVTAIAACSSSWAPGPNVSSSDFEPAKASCSLMARHGGGGFAAYGSTSFVAGAALGNAMAEGARETRDFNDCMEASGFRQITSKKLEAIKEEVAKLKPLVEAKDSCVAAVRANPEYAILLPHLSDLHTGKYTFSQMADTNKLNPEESFALTRYEDAVNPCLSTFVADAAKVVPAATPVWDYSRAASQSTILHLVHDDITWGRAAQEQTDISKETMTRLQKALY